MQQLELDSLYNGDCLDLLSQCPKASAIITDPPYMINTKSDGQGKLSPWADYCNAAHWYAKWFEMARDRLLPDGCMWAFLNWRSLVTYQKASCDIRWPIASLLVWDKAYIGTGNLLRSSYELVALWVMPSFSIKNRSLADIQRFAWSTTKPHGHPAEKPEALMEWLMECSTEEGDVVIDPFMGSGTTCAAARTTGRKYIGIEQDRVYFEIAQARLSNHQNQQSLFV